MNNIKAFYSDPHFGHKNIIGFANRPFEGVRHMEEELRQRYNSKIGENDTVLWVGDCFFCSPGQAKHIMDGLNGHKILIRGNHDSGQSRMSKLGFDLVLEECVIDIGNKTARVNHFPYWEERDSHDDRYKDRRPKKYKGEVLIHGHTHRREKLYKNMVHIGLDAWNCGPAMWDDVEKIVAKI